MLRQLLPVMLRRLLPVMLYWPLSPTAWTTFSDSSALAKDDSAAIGIRASSRDAESMVPPFLTILFDSLLNFPTRRCLGFARFQSFSDRHLLLRMEVSDLRSDKSRHPS